MGKMSDDSFNRVLNLRTNYEEKTTAAERKKALEMFSSEDAAASRKQLVESIVSEASPDLQAYQQSAMAQQMAAGGGAGGMSGGMPMGGGGMGGTPVPAAGPGAMSPQAVASSMEGQPGSMMDPAEMQVMQKVYGRAQQTAMELFRMPVPDRSTILRDIEAQNPMLASLIQQAIGELEKQAQKAGLQAGRDGSMPVQPM